MLEDLIHELRDAIRNKDKKKEEQILKVLAKSGMDRYTALLLVKDPSV